MHTLPFLLGMRKHVTSRAANFKKKNLGFLIVNTLESLSRRDIRGTREYTAPRFGSTTLKMALLIVGLGKCFLTVIYCLLCCSVSRSDKVRPGGAASAIANSFIPRLRQCAEAVADEADAPPACRKMLIRLVFQHSNINVQNAWAICHRRKLYK